MGLIRLQVYIDLFSPHNRNCRIFREYSAISYYDVVKNVIKIDHPDWNHHFHLSPLKNSFSQQLQRVNHDISPRHLIMTSYHDISHYYCRSRRWKIRFPWWAAGLVSLEVSRKILSNLQKLDSRARLHREVPKWFPVHRYASRYVSKTVICQSDTCQNWHVTDVTSRLLW